MTCEARGYPEPRIIWKRELGGPIEHVLYHGKTRNRGKGPSILKSPAPVKIHQIENVKIAFFILL